MLKINSPVREFINSRYPKACHFSSFRYKGYLEIQFYPHPDAEEPYCCLVHPTGHIEILTEF